MKFKLVENIDDRLEEGKLYESYKQLWRQFIQLIDKINIADYDLHHIYDPSKSEVDGKINYLLLPSKLHKSVSPLYEQAIKNYDELKKAFPDKFETLNVRFELFTPDDVEECVRMLKACNAKAKYERAKAKKKINKTV